VLIAHHSTSAAITPHAADRAWIVFFQTALPAGVLSPIRIVGLKGSELSREHHRLAEMNAYEVQIIGLISTPDPDVYARAIAEQYAGALLHDRWYTPSADLIAFIQHHAKKGLQELLGQVHPGAINEHVVDLHTMARMLGCAEITVRRMAERGTIPSMRAGRNYRFQPADVVAALQRRGVVKVGRSAP
jgi:excisionase family DNA binding protein